MANSKTILLLVPVLLFSIMAGCLQQAKTEKMSRTGVVMDNAKLVSAEQGDIGFKESWVLEGNKVADMYKKMKGKYSGWDVLYDHLEGEKAELVFSTRTQSVRIQIEYKDGMTYLNISAGT